MLIRCGLRASARIVSKKIFEMAHCARALLWGSAFLAGWWNLDQQAGPTNVMVETSRSLFAGQYPDIAAGSLDEVYVAWFDQGAIRFACSRDRGARFSLPIDISVDAHAAPDLAIGSRDGLVAIVWTEFTEAGREIRFSSSNAASSFFSTPQPVSTPSVGASETPAVAIDGKSNIYVVWVDETSENSTILFNRSTDAGNTFQKPTMLSAATGFSSSPQIAVDSDEGIYVIWAFAPEPESVKHALLLRHSADRGRTFLPAVQVAPADVDFLPRLAAGNGGEVYATWMRPSGIVFSTSADGGSRFSSPQLLGRGHFPDIAADVDKRVFVVWNLDGVQMRISMNGGESFFPALRLADGLDPKVALGGNGYGYVVGWQPVEDGTTLSFFAVRSGTGVTQF